MIRYNRETPPIQIRSKFLHRPDNGKTPFLCYGIVIFSRAQSSARVGDNTFRGGIGTLEKDRTKIVPTGVGMNNREGGLVKMARTGPDMSAFFSVLKAVSQSSVQRNGVRM